MNSSLVRCLSIVPLLGVVLASSLCAQSDIRLTSDTGAINRTPGIIVRNGSLLVSWGEGTTSYDADRYFLSRWEPDSHGPATFIGSRVPEPMPDPPYFISNESYNKNESLLRTDNLIIAEGVHSRMDYTGPRADPAQESLVFSARLETYIPLDTGWKATKVIEMGRPWPGSEQMGVNYWGLDPNSDNIVMAATYRSSTPQLTQRWVFSLDRDGNELWTVNIKAAADNSLPPAAIVPVGDQEFLAAGDSNCLHFKGESVVGTLAFSTVANAYYRRLLGDRFLRYFYSSDQQLQLELYDLSGHLVRSGSITIPGIRNYVYIVQNPSDSSLAFVWGGNDGLRMSHLDKFLAIHAENVRLNVSDQTVSAPAAVFRNDTLYAVWEHYRDGDDQPRDIYGIGVAIPRITTVASVVSPGGTGHLTSSIFPNPVHSMLTLRFELGLPGAFHIDMYDNLGRHVKQVDRGGMAEGDHEEQLNVSDLGTGIYLLRVEGEGWSESHMITVVR